MSAEIFKLSGVAFRLDKLIGGHLVNQFILVVDISLLTPGCFTVSSQVYCRKLRFQEREGNNFLKIQNRVLFKTVQLQLPLQ